MKKTYIKPDIKILKMGTSSIICASNRGGIESRGTFLIGDDQEYEARYDKGWTIDGDIEFDHGETDTR